MRYKPQVIFTLLYGSSITVLMYILLQINQKAGIISAGLFGLLYTILLFTIKDDIPLSKVVQFCCLYFCTTIVTLVVLKSFS